MQKRGLGWLDGGTGVIIQLPTYIPYGKTSDGKNRSTGSYLNALQSVNRFLFVVALMDKMHASFQTKTKQIQYVLAEAY